METHDPSRPRQRVLAHCVSQFLCSVGVADPILTNTRKQSRRDDVRTGGCLAC